MTLYRPHDDGVTIVLEHVGSVVLRDTNVDVTIQGEGLRLTHGTIGDAKRTYNDLCRALGWEGHSHPGVAAED